MQVSNAGLAFVKSWEGFEPNAYRDIAGVWTIGYGHTEGFKDGRFTESSTVTECESQDLLREDISSRESAIMNAVSVELQQNEFDALVSLVYNIGAGNFQRSTVLRRLNQGDRDGAADAFLWWNKARVGGALCEVRGLTRRRIAERAMFLGGDVRQA